MRIPTGPVLGGRRQLALLVAATLLTGSAATACDSTGDFETGDIVCVTTDLSWPGNGGRLTTILAGPYRVIGAREHEGEHYVSLGTTAGPTDWLPQGKLEQYAHRVGSAEDCKSQPKTPAQPA